MTTKTKNAFIEKKADSPKKEPLFVRPTGKIDWWLLILALVILCTGLIMVLSASAITANQSSGDKYFFFRRQIIFAVFGCLAMWIAASMPRAILYRLQYPALFISLILLLITLSPLVQPINGAKRWITIGTLHLQPMEFVKISLALYLAYFMSSKQDLVQTFSRGVIPPFAVTALFAFLLLLQPDFGSAVVMTGLLFFMCVAGGTRFIYIFISLALAIAAAISLIYSSPYRMRRLLAFIDPFKDSSDTGYQLVQSLLAFGSGGLSGLGIGAGRQKMFYLPEAHNDFIMAVLAEETGFIGVSIVLLLFVLLFWRCYRIIIQQQDLRDRFTAFGLTCIIAMGAIINLAVAMGLAPPKGVPMPLFSYGGSNLLSTMVCLGLLLNFSRSIKNKLL